MSETTVTALPTPRDSLDDVMVNVSFEQSVQDEFSAGLKLLQLTHSEAAVLKVTPSDPALTSFLICPYYMNRSDPSDIGTWGIYFDGEEPVRISSNPAAKHAHKQFEVTQVVADSDGNKVKKVLSAEESARYAASLKYAGDRLESNPEMFQFTKEDQSVQSQDVATRGLFARFRRSKV